MRQQSDAQQEIVHDAILITLMGAAVVCGKLRQNCLGRRVSETGANGEGILQVTGISTAAQIRRHHESQDYTALRSFVLQQPLPFQSIALNIL